MRDNVSKYSSVQAKVLGITVTFNEGGTKRSVYRDVNSGGSFGSNPLRQHVGIGQANIIDRLEIKWPATNKTQVFRNIPVDINIKIREGDDKYIAYKLNQCDFQSIKAGLIPCPPKN